MSAPMMLSSGEYVDLHTNEGAYRHVGEFLKDNGASSSYFSSLGRLYPRHDKYLYAALREIVNRIELCGASPELTNAVSLASDLAAAIGDRHNNQDKNAAYRVCAELGVNGV